MSEPQRHFAVTLILTIATASLLGLLSWIALNTAATREDLAALKVKIEASVDTDRRVDTELLNLRARVATLELEVAVLKRPKG